MKKFVCWECSKVFDSEKYFQFCSFECMTDWMRQQYLDSNTKHREEFANREEYLRSTL